MPSKTKEKNAAIAARTAAASKLPKELVDQSVQRPMTVREIQGFPAERYGTEVSPEFISTVTDAVMAEVAAWQARPLEPRWTRAGGARGTDLDRKAKHGQQPCAADYAQHP